MTYRPVNERFWRDPEVLKLNSEEKLLFLYLITCPSSHYSGLFYMPADFIVLETGIDRKKVSSALAVLESKSMVFYDNLTLEIFVVNMAKFQVLNWKQIKGIENHFKNSIQSKVLMKRFSEKYPEMSDEINRQVEDIEISETPDIPTAPEKSKRTANAKKPDTVDQKVWDDYLKTRKAPLTETGLDGLTKEAEKAGITLQEAMKICCDKGWRGFDSKWIAGKGKQICESDKDYVKTNGSKF